MILKLWIKRLISYCVSEFILLNDNIHAKCSYCSSVLYRVFTKAILTFQILCLFFFAKNNTDTVWISEIGYIDSGSTVFFFFFV